MTLPSKTAASTSAPEGYVHPLTGRYASAEMQRAFSPARKFTTWRRLWIALAESQKQLGLEIPDDAVRQMKDVVEDIDLGRAAELERRFRHDVMAHVYLYGEAAPAARAIIHLGATSAFVSDNADLIIHREALTLVRDRVVRSIAALADFARRYRSLSTLGYTHFQPAQPTTVGKRATLWIQDLLLDLEEVEFRLRSLRFRGVRGTTGSQASFLDLFDGNHAKVEALDGAVARRMDFERRYDVSGQTYPRKVDAAVLGTLSGVAVSASKMAHDLRLLAHLREVEEPFESEQIGSSAMPYKRNPMRAERICALTRHVITLYQDAAVTAATQWLERSLDDSANRRLSLPDAFLTLDGALVLVENVSSGLIVNESVVRRSLQTQLPFMATETILMRATADGGDRQSLHERIRQHAHAAARKMKEDGADPDLLERIADDDAFGLDLGELTKLLDTARFVGRAPEQVDHFLEGAVQPVLDRLGPAAQSSLGAPEVLV